MLVWLHIFGSQVIRIVPRRLAHALAGWLTPIGLLFARGYLDRATLNMRQILGPSADPRQARSLTRAAFANYARYMIELLRLPHVDPREFLERVEVIGWENVDAAYGEGRGVVFVTGHIGNWDLAGAAFVARGRPVSALVETLKPLRWNKRVQQIRERVGVKAIPIESGLREMFSALKRKEGLAVLVDRPVQEDGVPVVFFGRGTRVPAGAATLALRTGSPIVPAVVVRHPHRDAYVAHIGEPLLPVITGRHTPADVQALTQRFMSWLEGMIRLYPDQWYMFRHMWPPLASPQAAMLNVEASPV